MSVPLIAEMNEGQVELIAKLDLIYHELAIMTGTIQFYGFVIVPLFILCTCLWWFFKQFLYRY